MTLPPIIRSVVQSRRLRLSLSRGLLVLAICWQAMIGFMPVAHAKAMAGESGWETVCTMQGSTQVWVADQNTDTDQQAKPVSYCPICVAGQAGIAPPPAVVDVSMHRAAGVEVGQVAFTAAYLTRAWSEPATGPPAQL